MQSSIDALISGKYVSKEVNSKDYYPNGSVGKDIDRSPGQLGSLEIVKHILNVRIWLL